jgi:hypothetical protein
MSDNAVSVATCKLMFPMETRQLCSVTTRTIEPTAKEYEHADSLVTCENQWDSACGDVGVVGHRISHCTVQ